MITLVTLVPAKAATLPSNACVVQISWNSKT
jgi:hypothetical protein